jgi:DNA polymerase-3 subunit chi
MPVPKVEFHTQVQDRLLYACRLLRKAASSGAQVLVTADEETLAQFDQLLWKFSAIDFVPHCTAEAPKQQLENTPIVLSASPPAHSQLSIMLNLGPDLPAGFEQFARIIEIVSEDMTDRQQARKRWKRYASAGCALSIHDLQALATA